MLAHDSEGFVQSGFIGARLRSGLSQFEPRICSKKRKPVRYQRLRAVIDMSSHENDVSPKNAEDTHRNTTTTDSVDSSETQDFRGQEGLETEEEWYTITKEISKADEIQSIAVPSSDDGEEPGVLDLGAVDDSSRKILTRNSYAGVVDVDIEEGGLLGPDEDNNDMFCGVGLDALVESEELMENLEKNFTIQTATHVQLAAIPRVADGKDIVIQSHTGSGKTLAFLLPVLDEIDIEQSSLQAVIVVPTRELGMQISRECDRLIEGTDIRNLALIGGANPARQIEKLRKQHPHIVVGTPGRLAELHENRDINFKHLQVLVVDEVDQCLQEVFMKHIVYLIEAVRGAQKVLVSATGDVESVRHFAGSHLQDPILLRVGGSQRIPGTIAHWHYLVPARLRIEALRKLMYSEPVPRRAIVFVDDPRRVDIVTERLHRMKVPAVGLRGNAHKLERAEVLTAFRKGRANLLVTTEVAARGLDVREITHVINLDLPTDGDHYLHRAGRCGRVGAEGHVISITTADKAFVMSRLARELGIEITRMEPRGGTYLPPLDRSKMVKQRRERGTRSDERPTGRVPLKNVSTRARASENGKSFNESVEFLQQAVQQADLNMVEKNILEHAEARGEGLAVFGVTEKRKKIKERTKKDSAKAKVKATLKAKQKAASKTKKTDANDSVSRGRTAEQRRALREKKRLSTNYGERAKSEGWVGNR
ncbi:DEAD-box ATP-dependent RNA helicase CshC [Gracilariopsis chorda]|uniref:DEAD-box ATP-dependent RNA helicase CshC n=1 Tax=Gracilariopsis chorda TaxID=448386 RepID=A0A2V3J0J3_9FLOR|nr:DEAD-box ATP-dependent RNA helicase CshC [Gracilariopsis chorda]|eukprot:PXF47932.1 DEAD-box ATP-dependent RNA helicase CshC [Gracilariopsis chorda]